MAHDLKSGVTPKEAEQFEQEVASAAQLLQRVMAHGVQLPVEERP
jgi:hypothetical protein